MKKIIYRVVTSLNLVMVWGVILLLIITPPLFLAALAAGAFDRRRTGNGVHNISRLWGRILMACSFCKFEIAGMENIEPGRHYIFCSNHTSQFDIFILLAFLPAQFRFLTKESIFKLPLFGWVVRHAQYIPIDRSNARDGIRSLEEAAARVRGGASVIIYPEGTRTRDGRIGEFKRGGFLLAVKTGLPIIPVTISGGHRIMPAKTARIYPGKVKIVFGRPIPINGDDRTEQARLMKEVREAVIANYDPDYGARD